MFSPIDWLREQCLGRGLLAAEDLDLFYLTDSTDEVVRLVAESWQSHLKKGDVR